MENLKVKIQEAVNLYKSGNLIKCEELTKNLIKKNPKVVFLHNLFGMVLSALNKPEEAEKSYNQGIQVDPNFAIIYNNLALIYYNKISIANPGRDFQLNVKKAEDLFKKSLMTNSKLAEPNTNLGNLYSLIGMNDKSIKYHKLAISADPKYYYSYLNIANVYVSIGNFDEAKKYLNKAITQNPNFSFAHRLLSRLTKYTNEDHHLTQLRKLYENINSKDNINKMNLGFALGKANEDIKNYDESFKYYKTANAINRSKINFSVKKEENYFNEIKRTYNENLFKKYKNLGSENSSPIFIVGMPRSGSTLVEQILSSHSKVFGADEIAFIPSLIKKYFNEEKINLFLQGVFDFDTSSFKKMGNEYINLLKSVSNNSERTTDKLLPNFLYIGLIKLILPKSKIIHCQRNPKDNIFSIYKNHFPGNKITFASDLNDTVAYYNLYTDLMNFWNELLPVSIFNIKYEDLINNTEDETRKLLKFCDLKWEEKCLKFHENKRTIKTASDTQIRSKIYNSSIDLWKKYEKHLNDYFVKLNTQR